MAKIVLICGKICSGKSYYASRLKDELNAVVLSCDELMRDILPYDLGEQHDETAAKVRCYLHKKASELVKAGVNVILEFGFWGSEDRKSVSEYYSRRGIAYEWHYVDISDRDWLQNIEDRNRAVTQGLSKDYYLDEGLMHKLLSLFEKPGEDEITVWYKNARA